MLPAAVNGPPAGRRTPAAAWAAEPAANQGGVGTGRAAARFFATWPDPQAWADEPLAVRLAADAHLGRPLNFLMLHGYLRPGYDYLLSRKLATIWRDLPGSPLAGDVDRFGSAAAELGYRPAVAKGMVSQVLVRVLVQTGRPMGQLTEADLDEFAAAVQAHETGPRDRLRHYRHALHATRTVLFHLGVLSAPPPVPAGRRPHSVQDRLHGISPALLDTFLSYLRRRRAPARRARWATPCPGWRISGVTWPPSTRT